jgi:polygalacturonase
MERMQLPEFLPSSSALEDPQTSSRRYFLTGMVACASISLVTSAYGQSARRRISVKDFGAKGDANTLDTAAIQRAIDVCSDTGGGVVWFPPGGYVTGTILIKKNVSLNLSQGTTILGSLNPLDYRLLEPFVDGVGTTRGHALIGCIDVSGVGIFGEGVIDGRGAELQTSAGKIPSAKPFLLLCSRSTSVELSGVKLINSGAWTLHISQCIDVRVTGLTIRSIGLANNDGIDIDSSQRVRVERCTIETGDDAICLKTTSSIPCRDITVTGCTLTTRCAAFKIGTESAGDFSAIRVSNCHVVEANLGAVKILSVDGANISDVIVEKLRVDSADTPIFLRLGDRGRTFRPGAVARAPGTLTNVVIRDVDVKQARRIGILLAGIPGHAISHISLERIAISLVGDPVTKAIPEPPEVSASYPEVRMFGAVLPAFGIYARHTRGIKMKHIQIRRIPGDTRPETVFPESL